MVYAWILTPLGRMAALAQENALCGLWFEGQKHFGLPEEAQPCPEHPVLQAAHRWVKAYFSGQPLPPMPALAPRGTAYQLRVWQALREIPYGETLSYGKLAKRLASSPRAVGSAVGRNPISLMIPCHRVVGAKGALTGYAGGLERKRFLLTMESEVL